MKRLLKFSFNFCGQISREQFISGMAGWIISCLVTAVVCIMWPLLLVNPGSSLGAVYAEPTDLLKLAMAATYLFFLLYLLLTFIVSLALTTKRLRDTGWPIGLVLINFLPLINLCFAITLCFILSKPNEFKVREKISTTLSGRPKTVKWMVWIGSIVPFIAVVGGAYAIYTRFSALGASFLHYVGSSIGILMVAFIYVGLLYGISKGVRSLAYFYLAIFNLNLVTSLVKAQYISSGLFLAIDVIFLILLFSKPTKEWFKFCNEARKNKLAI